MVDDIDDPPLRQFVVTLPPEKPGGKTRMQVVEAMWAFDNSGCLVLRRGAKGASRIVAAFSPLGWVSCVEMTETGPRKPMVKDKAK